MSQLFAKHQYDLRRQIVQAFSHANFFLLPGIFFNIVAPDHKLDVIEVFSEAYVIDGVAENAFEYYGNVNASFAILLNIGQPLVTLYIQMLFEHACHNL